MNFTELLIKYYFRKPDSWLLPLGTEHQKGSMGAKVFSKDVWRYEKPMKKIKSIIFFKWSPSENIIIELARKYLIFELFGGPDNFGDQLFKLMTWHFSQIWDDELSELDKVKAEAMMAMSGLTLLRYDKIEPELLSLNLATKFPMICFLAYPMIVKIPVVSMRNFLFIDSPFAFNSIRKSNHPFARQIISYLYEILFLQQKIAISLYEFYYRILYAENNKKESLFINAEVNAIMYGDSVFTYLKASIEKIIALIGYTHEIDSIDSKKTHSARINALNEIPKKMQESHYFEFIMEFVKSENLDEINSYRTGLLHRFGISELQPHNYVGEKAEKIPLRKIFSILHEQHSKNTAILICALAMLTDKLCQLDPPTYTFEDIPWDKDWLTELIKSKVELSK